MSVQWIQQAINYVEAHLCEDIRYEDVAAQEFQATDLSVTDAAFKYGYESPESFSKAFSRFHGSTPRQAKQNGACWKTVIRCGRQGRRTMRCLSVWEPTETASARPGVSSTGNFSHRRGIRRQRMQTMKSITSRVRKGCSASCGFRLEERNPCFFVHLAGRKRAVLPKDISFFHKTS